MFKYFTIFVIAFVACQGRDISPYNQYDLSQYTLRDARGFLETAQQAIEYLYEVVSDAISYALQKLYDAYDYVYNLVSETISAATDKITSIVSGALATLKELTDKAAAVGVSISSCVGDQQDVIVALGKEILWEITSCVTDQFNIIQTTIDAAAEEINSTLNDVWKLADDLKDCGLGITSIPCYITVAKDAAALVISAPAKIIKKVYDTISQATSIQANITKCAVEKGAAYAADVAKIVAEISSCAYELINQAGVKRITQKLPVLKLAHK